METETIDNIQIVSLEQPQNSFFLDSKALLMQKLFLLLLPLPFINATVIYVLHFSNPYVVSTIILSSIVPLFAVYIVFLNRISPIQKLEGHAFYDFQFMIIEIITRKTTRIKIQSTDNQEYLIKIYGSTIIAIPSKTTIIPSYS